MSRGIVSRVRSNGPVHLKTINILAQRTRFWLSLEGVYIPLVRYKRIQNTGARSQKVFGCRFAPAYSLS